MENKYQVIALVGKTGAGKDMVQKTTCKKHPLMFHQIINCTTRPQREKEVHGVDYNFISIEDFTRKVLNGTMLEATEFRDWFYGTPEEALVKNKINLGIFNPTGVEALLEDPRLDVLVVEVIAKDKTRLWRCLNREKTPDCTEICRRFLADEKDFLVLSEWEEFAVVSNEDWEDPDLLVKLAAHSEWFASMWRSVDTDIPFETVAGLEYGATETADKNN